MITNEIKLNLSVVSSILNFAGCDGLLSYLSIETYKRLEKEEYVDFSKIGEYSFTKDKDKWLNTLNKLVSMKLATGNNNKFITRKKLKEWKVFAEDKTKGSLKLNGFIYFDMTELYKMRTNRKSLRDFIYMSLTQSVIKGKSISRKFIQTLTGLGEVAQKGIEERYKDGELINKNIHHLPLNDSEITDGKFDGKPVFAGKLVASHNSCNKTKKRANCVVVQLGNKTSYNNSSNILRFKAHYNNSSKKASVTELLKKSKFHDWYDAEMVIDNSENSKTIKSRGIVSKNDPRYSTWKDFKHYDHENVVTISGDGVVAFLRDNLNQI